MGPIRNQPENEGAGMEAETTHINLNVCRTNKMSERKVGKIT